jgi:uncharacterized OB-fold protein
VTDAETRPLPPHALSLVEGAARGVLLLQRCPACGELPSFPRIACPACFAELEWVEASGRGRVVTFAVVRRPHHERFAAHLPVVLAVIELAEGPQVISSVVGDDRLETSIGAEVSVTAAPCWSSLPQFRLVR